MFENHVFLHWKSCLQVNTCFWKFWYWKNTFSNDKSILTLWVAVWQPNWAVASSLIPTRPIPLDRKPYQLFRKIRISNPASFHLLYHSLWIFLPPSSSFFAYNSQHNPSKELVGSHHCTVQSLPYSSHDTQQNPKPSTICPCLLLPHVCHSSLCTPPVLLGSFPSRALCICCSHF